MMVGDEARKMLQYCHVRMQDVTVPVTTKARPENRGGVQRDGIGSWHGKRGHGRAREKRPEPDGALNSVRHAPLPLLVTDLAPFISPSQVVNNLRRSRASARLCVRVNLCQLAPAYRSAQHTRRSPGRTSVACSRAPPMRVACAWLSSITIRPCSIAWRNHRV